MPRTHCTTLEFVRVPKVKVKMPGTVCRAFIKDSTPPPMDIASCCEHDYSEAQFSADLQKASKSLDLMVQKALKEHAAGKTRQFPA